ncbi:MAG: NADH-quinone oxidoreductase subunit D [Thermoplasmatota archaeon]
MAMPTPDVAPRIREEGRRGPYRLVTINMGPQHPSTHGVLRLKVTLDGETVMGVHPVIGYLHRGTEKLFEDGSFLQSLPFTDRLDYLAAIHNNWAVCHAVEQLVGVQVPERAEYIRGVAGELQRVASHLLWLGTFGLDIGAMTPFFWCMRDREGALQLIERLTGARITINWLRFGGVKNDLPPYFLEETKRYVDYLRLRIPEYRELLEQNDIVRARARHIGVLPRDRAIAYGCSGPMARASGVDFDLRRDEPFCAAYQKVKWRVVTRQEGDIYSRFLCRMDEMDVSLDILEQLCAAMPEGDYVSPDVGEGARQHRLKVPAGEIYSRIEGARGEYGVYVVSDGTNKPYRMKWRAPTLSNLHPLEEMTRGFKIPDLVATLGSIDIVLGDLDR